MHDVRAALLAGGKGERLGRLTQRAVKPLVPFGGTCRLVDFSLACARRSGIGEVVLMSFERERDLIRHVLRWWDDQPGFRVHLGPNERLRDGLAGAGAEPAQPLAIRQPEAGTADALLTNEAYVFAEPVRDVLVQHADHVYLYDYRRMLADHRCQGADVTIGVQRIERRFVRLFGMVDVDPGGRVLRLVEKPAEPTSDLIFTAFAFFRAEVLRDVLHKLREQPDWQHDISRDVLPFMISHDFRVRAFEVQGYWADIGTLERYHLGHLELLANPTLMPPTLRPRTLLPPRWDGSNLLAPDCTLAGQARSSYGYAGSVVEHGASVVRSILMPGSRVRPGVSVRDSIVWEDEILSSDRIGLDSLGFDSLGFDSLGFGGPRGLR
ncbi:MAG TPA: sugar phosphate nucleotidyltransferase [Jatrophihabitans sp.]|jgi:glucose-1-phosphate adenylyltransferase|nr:sugar phosphate nucleotidyltransferase [Jatrophihabitans sp.]